MIGVNESCQQCRVFKYEEYITIAQARKLKDEAKRLLANGINPSQQRKNEKLKKQNEGKNSFELIAREYFDIQKDNLSPSTVKKNTSLFENNIFPFIGANEISSITPLQILNVIRKIENRGRNETAHRVLQICGKVFRYAVITNKTTYNPTTDLRGALKSVVVTHQSATIEPHAFGRIIKTIEGYGGSFIVGCALKLLPLVFVRPTELTTAKWADICFEKNEWRFTATKTKTQHIVPLAKQSQTILKEIYELSGNGVYVFPSIKIGSGRPMSRDTLNAALRRMDITKEEMCAHGFRASARTIIAENLKDYSIDLIEHQLAHAVKDPNGRAYNRTSFLNERTKMMQAWADYLDKLKGEKQ